MQGCEKWKGEPRRVKSFNDVIFEMFIVAIENRRSMNANFSESIARDIHYVE